MRSDPSRGYTGTVAMSICDLGKVGSSPFLRGARQRMRKLWDSDGTYLRSEFVRQGRDTQPENTLASRFGPVMPDMELQPSAGSSGCLTVVRPMVLVTAVRLLHPGLVQGSSRMATKRENGAKASNLLPGRARIGPPSYLMYSGSGGREEAPRSGGALSFFSASSFCPQWIAFLVETSPPELARSGRRE